MASNVGYEDEDGRRNVSLPVSESIASSQTPVRELAMSSIQKLMIQGILIPEFNTSSGISFLWARIKI